ncbi:sigma-70 family RNA polymerase sigma factor [candidate division KSB1 bacterium]|nr:sigma-70 family RNA polymerase sigma factor [candidate division KSB1 bacterium]
MELETESTMEETDWIVKCRNGDADAFARLVQPYRRPLFAFLLRLCGDRALAEDALQETLIKIWTRIGTFKLGNRFSSWVMQIAYRTAVDQKRRRKDGRLFYSDVLPEWQSPDDPTRRLELDERRRYMHRALEELPENQRQVFLLRLDGELTFKEIAALLGQPLNTVLSRMNQAVKKLQKRMEHYRDD